jgi:hypothetical protein
MFRTFVLEQIEALRYPIQLLDRRWPDGEHEESLRIPRRSAWRRSKNSFQNAATSRATKRGGSQPPLLSRPPTE